MKVKKATKKYEQWLAANTTVVKADLELKHTHMAEDLFCFLRATFYRWMQMWPVICPDLNRAPVVLAVGDLHVENFGTWRDIEGRLIWGINDFDEVYPLPYTIDLVRLTTSAALAIQAGHLALKPEAASMAVLKGYTESLKAGGQPFVLAEQHPSLRDMALGELRDPIHFWTKIDRLPTLKKNTPRSALKAMMRMMPGKNLDCRIAHRVAGLGSLGRQRFAAIAEWHGGRVCREAKALLPSACRWAKNGKGSHKIFYQTVLDQAVRCRDPFVRLCGRWLVRRLAPDCSRIELSSLPKKRDEARLLHAMGWETANIHLGSLRAIKQVRRDLERRKKGWLDVAAETMLKATSKDWQDWRKSRC